MGDLTGKKVFITGAEQGIGRATAERLIKAGCDIYFHYHSDESGPKALVALAHSLGQRPLTAMPISSTPTKRGAASLPAQNFSAASIF